METIDALWDYHKPSESEARFRALLPSLADEPGRLELLTQIARAQGLQRRFEDADGTLDDVERGLERAPEAKRPAIRYRLERGRVANSRGDRMAARPWFVAAWEAARAAGDDALAVDAAHMVAIASDEPERLAWNERALALAESSPQPGAARWRASLLNNLGWGRMDRGDHAGALELFERAVVARAAMGDARALHIARWAVARAQRALGRLDEALASQRALAAELERAGDRDGYVDEEIAECLLAQGHADRAAPYFARAHAALRDDPGLTGEPERLVRMLRLSGGG